MDVVVVKGMMGEERSSRKPQSCALVAGVVQYAFPRNALGSATQLRSMQDSAWNDGSRLAVWNSIETRPGYLSKSQSASVVTKEGAVHLDTVARLVGK